MTVESWREQRSYLVNALGVIDADPKYGAFAKELSSALRSIRPAKPDTSGYTKPGSIKDVQTCGAVELSFGPNGELASVSKAGKGWKGFLGGFQYQSLSSQNFTDFCMDYGNKGCKATTENPGCHNFHKPNMSSANPVYMVVRPVAAALYVKNDKKGCSFLVQSKLSAVDMIAHTKYGAPDTVWTTVTVDAASASADNAKTSVSITSTKLPPAWPRPLG